MRPFIRHIAATALLCMGACTQPPAEVNMKGQNSYTRGNEGSSIASQGWHPAPVTYGSPYAAPPEVAQPTQQSAQVQPIGVSDLSAPIKSAPTATRPAIAPVQAPPAMAASTAPVNPWTNKPRFSETSSPQQSVAPVAQLDSIISSDNPPKAPASPAPVVASAAPVAAPEKPAEKPVEQVAEAPPATANSFIWPVATKKILSGFGPKGGGKVNDGVNIASAEGEPVWAAATGEVVYAGNDIKGYGNMVLIKHAGNKTTGYAHLSRISVDKYARVKQGDIIGYVGSTGDVKEPQLHFVVRNGKEPVDPEKVMGKS